VDDLVTVLSFSLQPAKKALVSLSENEGSVTEYELSASILTGCSVFFADILMCYSTIYKIKTKKCLTARGRNIIKCRERGVFGEEELTFVTGGRGLL
jgi:hypothetical protein